MPRGKADKIEKKPEYFAIFGNGFTPSEKQAKIIIFAWLEKRKPVLGSDAAIGVRADLVYHSVAPRMEFFKVVSEFQNSHPGQVTDDLLILDQKSGKDMALIAVWPPEDTDYIKTLLNSEKKQGSQAVTVEKPNTQKKWWEFWK